MLKKLAIVAAFAATLALVAVQGQQKTAKSSTSVMTLTAQDYIDIQQLVARYAYAIDKCTNSGYDYADLYTPDGVFSIADENGVPGTARFEGRERLAVAAGGGKGGCVDPKTVPDRYSMAHIVANHVITPTSEGVTGKSYLLVVGFGDPTAKGTAAQPARAYSWGGYDDVYVKTAKLKSSRGDYSLQRNGSRYFGADVSLGASGAREPLSNERPSGKVTRRAFTKCEPSLAR